MCYFSVLSSSVLHFQHMPRERINNAGTFFFPLVHLLTLLSPCTQIPPPQAVLNIPLHTHMRVRASPRCPLVTGTQEMHYHLRLCGAPPHATW